MAVPKRKTSKSRRDMRSACKFIRTKNFAHCEKCNTAVLPHQMCGTCGFYKGRKVMATKADRAVARYEARKAARAAAEASEAQQEQQG